MDRNLKASERNALQALLLESKLSSLRQGSALDKAEEGNIVSNRWLHHTLFPGAMTCCPKLKTETERGAGPEAVLPACPVLSPPAIWVTLRDAGPVCPPVSPSHRSQLPQDSVTSSERCLHAKQGDE